MRRARWIVGVAAALSVVFLAGPRVKIDAEIAPVILPEDLDTYLAHLEAAYADLRPGTERIIHWADAERKHQTPLSIVYVHGFSASRQEVAPLCDSLATRLGANVYYARLTGHGETGEALGEARVRDWLQDGVEALAIGERIGERVVLIGTSTGATLLAWLAATQPMDHVAAVVMMSPNFGVRDERASILLWPWGKLIASMLAGGRRTWKPLNEEQGRFWTTSYPIDALVSMMGLVALASEDSAAGVGAPVLVLYSPYDQVVDPDKTVKQFERMYHPLSRLQRLSTEDPRHHILAGRIISPETTMNVVSVIEEFVGRTIVSLDGNIAAEL